MAAVKWSVSAELGEMPTSPLKMYSKRQMIRGLSKTLNFSTTGRLQQMQARFAHATAAHTLFVVKNFFIGLFYLLYLQQTNN